MAVAVATAPATWYVVRGSNDVYWRVGVPAKAIGANVCLIPMDTGKRQLSQPGLRQEFRWHETPEGAAYPDHEGAAVFTRPDQARAAHALAMKANGHRVIAEIDDNYMAPFRQNYFLRARWDDKARERHLGALAAFDAIIVTTNQLRDTYARELRKIGAKPDFFVCDNHVDPDDWPEPAPPSDRLRVGWMGGPSHQWDIKLAYPALEWAASAGHEVVIIGFDPEWHPQCDIRHTIRQGEQYGFPYTHIPWVDPREFDRSQARWPLDIALAPLRRDQFGLGKSDVKWLEYSMAGAVTVASAGTVYDEIRHGETGLLAASREDMLRCVQQLCANERLRRDMAASAQQYVREERLIGDHTAEWLEAIGCQSSPLSPPPTER